VTRALPAGTDASPANAFARDMVKAPKLQTK
jgi:hypothetical protein